MHIAMEWATLLAVLALPFWWKLLGQYFGSYVTEKGKNLATKEDIESITHLVESAKVEHAKELEQIKSDIAIQAARNSTFSESRRQAFLSFYEHCLNFVLSPFTSVSVADLIEAVNAKPGKAALDSAISARLILEREAEIFSQLSTILIDFYRMVLYADGQNKPLLLLAGEVVTATEEIMAELPSRFLSIRRAIFHEPRGDGAAVAAAVAKSIGECDTAISPLKDKMRKAFEDYQAGLNHQFRQEAGVALPPLPKAITADVDSSAE